MDEADVPGGVLRSDDLPPDVVKAITAGEYPDAKPVWREVTCPVCRGTGSVEVEHFRCRIY